MNSITKSLLVASCAALFASATLAEGATFSAVNGPVANNNVRAQSGQNIADGALIRTGRNGSATIAFPDGQRVALAPNTRFKLDGYAYKPENIKKSNSWMRLLTGGMRYVSGVIGKKNRNGVVIATRNATAGIRGTDFSLVSLNGVDLLDVKDGGVEFSTDQGSLVVEKGQQAATRLGGLPEALPPQLHKSLCGETCVSLNKAPGFEGSTSTPASASGVGATTQASSVVVGLGVAALLIAVADDDSGTASNHE